MKNSNENISLSETVIRILKLIKNRNYNKKELHTLYENINNEFDKDKITDH